MILQFYMNVALTVSCKQHSLKKTQTRCRHNVIQCCGTRVPSGVVQKLPSTVTKDAGHNGGGCTERNARTSGSDDCGTIQSFSHSFIVSVYQLVEGRYCCSASRLGKVNKLHTFVLLYSLWLL